MKWSILIPLIFLVSLLAPCSFARSRSTHHSSRYFRLFKATPESVPLENAYANRMMLTRYLDKRSIQRDVEAGILVPIPIPCSPRLPKDRRFALSATVQFLQLLDSEFESQTGHHLTVDSAVRTVKIQRSIRRWNRGAAPADGKNPSSHERGTTVDISRRMRKSEYRWLLWRLFYYREIGRVLVIEERNCLHVFVIGDPNGPERIGCGVVRHDEGRSPKQGDVLAVQGASDPEVLQ